MRWAGAQAGFQAGARQGAVAYPEQLSNLGETELQKLGIQAPGNAITIYVHGSLVQLQGCPVVGSKTGRLDFAQQTELHPQSQLEHWRRRGLLHSGLGNQARLLRLELLLPPGL